MVDLAKPKPQGNMEPHFELSKMLPIGKKGSAGKSIFELMPEEQKNWKAVGKGALEAGGLALSVAQPEVGLIRAIAAGAPKIAQGAMRVGAQTGYGGLGAPDNPELGAGMGAFGSLLTQLAGMKNPVVNALIRAATGGTIGGGAGYAVGGVPGAITGAGTGASLGIGAPYFKNKLGMASAAVAPEQQIINSLTPQETYKRARAANALDTTISPGEASGRADVTAQEAQLGRVGEGAAERIKLGNERLAEQKNAFTNLQKKISPNKKNALLDTRQAAKDAIAAREKTLSEQVEPLYEQARKEEISPDRFAKLTKSDKTIENAVNAVRTDPAYSVEISGYSPNSIKILDLAKRRIDADIEKALKNNDGDRARVLTASKNRLVQATDQFSPTYKEARSTYEEGIKPIEQLKNSKLGQIANIKDVNVKSISKMIFDPAQTDIKVLKQIRDEIRGQNPQVWDDLINNELTRLMSKGEVRGSTIFKQVLENDNVFNQLITALDHNPAAKKDLIYMRRAWKDLTNIESPRQGHGLTATGMKDARNDISAVIDMYTKMTNSEADIKALRVIYSKDWQDKLNKIVTTANKRLRSEQLGKFLSATIRGAVTIPSKESTQPKKK